METREQIRNRILRAAARQWGYQESEMDLEAFDPLVRLLVEACSGEVARLERLLEESETRILEGILEQLSPEVLTGPRPAHGVAFLRALSATETVSPELQCYAVRAEGEEKLEVYFSPLGEFPIVNGTVAYLEIGGERLSRIDENFQRETVATSRERTPRFASTIWLGLELDRKVKSLDNLRFFFNWLNAPRLTDNLEFLRIARWSCAGRPISTRIGCFPKTGPENDQTALTFLHQEYSRYHIARQRILDRYGPHFVELTGFTPGQAEEKLENLLREYPTEFEHIYPLEDLTGLDKKLLWLRVDFPTQLRREDLLATTCALNAVPIANLRRHRVEGRLRDQVNIIALDTDHHYFDLLTARNRSGVAYDEVPLTNIRQYQAGQYSVRRRDAGKFGQREASRALLNLLDALRDESAAFSAYGQDALRSKIGVLNQQLKDLEQLVGERSDEGASLAFLIVRPLERDRYLDVDYLSTRGREGNGIIVGQPLDLVRFAGVDRKSLRMLTTSTGGREPLSRRDRKHAYKKAIISRGRIVSREDIRAYCAAAFGEQLIGEVSILKGYEGRSGVSQGVERVMDVRLSLRPEEGETAETLSARAVELERELNFHTAGILPIRVTVVGTGETQTIGS